MHILKGSSREERETHQCNLVFHSIEAEDDTDLLGSFEDDTFVHVLGDIILVVRDVSFHAEDLVATEEDSDTLAHGHFHLGAMEGLVSDT